MANSIFNSLFGGLFDFNGDGKTTLDEEFIALSLFDDLEENKKAQEKPDELDEFVDEEDG